MTAAANLHVALALALGWQPSATDAQLVAEVERLVVVARGQRPPAPAPPGTTAAATDTLFDLEKAAP